VVLKEHVERHGIDVALRASYPGIRIVVLESVTEGAAETARIGIEALSTDGPIAVQDCDHAFSCPEVPDIFRNLLGTHDAALVGFRAHKPHFSYVELDGSGTVIGTVEKQVVSPFAIAGCYFYSSSELFHKGLAIFRDRNPYNELFLSGVTDALAEQAPGRVGFTELETHFPFGTPEEMARFDPALAMRVLPWARDTLLGTSE
jgi:hypothetical protein